MSENSETSVYVGSVIRRGANGNPRIRYSISELASEFGVSLRTLRFYENRGFLSPKREGTERIYDEREKNKLSVILKGKELGFTLSEIGDMLSVKSRQDNNVDLKISLDKINDQIRYLENQKVEVEQALQKLHDYKKNLI